MSDSSSQYSQDSVSPRASRFRHSTSPRTATLTPTEQQARLRRRLQLRGTVFLAMAVVLAGFTGPLASWTKNFLHGFIPTFDAHESSFLIKTTCPQRPEFSNLYIYYLRDTHNAGNAMLHKDSSVALNATLSPRDQHGFYKVLFKGPYSTTELVPHKNVEDLYGGLQPVGIGAGPEPLATYNNFYFSGHELRWKDEEDLRGQSIFDNWIACTTDRPDPFDQYNRSAKAIQLLYSPSDYSGQLPRECDTVKLILSKNG